jgi:hypothetical protein
VSQLPRSKRCSSQAALLAGGGIWLNDDSGTGHGPANITFQNNEIQVSGNAINAQMVEGTNHWSGNQLINVPSSSSAA